jgi:hypothetical protein
VSIGTSQYFSVNSIQVVQKQVGAGPVGRAANYTVKNQLFMCLRPACFETGFEFVSGFEEGQPSPRNKNKNKKSHSYRGGKIYAFWILTTILEPHDQPDACGAPQQ